MANLFLTPGKILTGEGALDLAADILKTFGKKALLVTDEMMVKLGNAGRVTALLDRLGMDYVIDAEINSEPCDDMIMSGVEQYLREGCDCLIAVGGGSPMDSMKAIAACAVSGRHINSFLGEPITFSLPPMCAIPTTAGTGSEATQFTIINNTRDQIKMLLKGPSLMADLAVVDPAFTMTAPPSVTSSTGLDALCHAVEAYTSVKAFPMADTMALSAVKRIFANLPECFHNGKNVQARANMATAALEAGMAFNNSSVTIIHGMSRPIGALYHVPHGLSNAMLMDQCLRFAVEGCPDRFCDLARTIGVYQQGMSEEAGAHAFLAAVSSLCREMRVQTPAEFGIDREDFFRNISKMADDALASGSPGNTRRSPSKQEIEEIYRSLF